MQATEANFDGLVGPTHNYAGLAIGNMASIANRQDKSYPKEAALQGLKKMKALADLGFIQGVLAPQERPDVYTLRRLGFDSIDDGEVLRAAAQAAPGLLASCSSAASMWTANAATVSPSADTQDGKVHITPANLNNRFHRSTEHSTTARILRSTFANPQFFVHHAALPEHELFGDEGAANHTRLCCEYGAAGLEIFTFGRALGDEVARPKHFPARQTREAAEAIARLHQLRPEQVLFVQQNPDVIDQGVFHNDVIAVGNANCLFYHEQAFLDETNFVAKIRRFFSDKTEGEVHLIRVGTDQVSVADAVQSYLFNSQLLSRAPDHMILVVPEECRQNLRVWSYLQTLTQDATTPIREIIAFDLKQSMKNGGGPACLRLRVVLNREELAAVNPATLMNDQLYATLTQWVEKHYRDELGAADLADSALLRESRAALDELTQILKLGSVYPFQRV